MSSLANQQWLTPKQVAERLQIHRDDVYRLIDSGELPARQIGRRWRILPSDLDELGKVEPPRRVPMPRIEAQPPQPQPSSRGPVRRHQSATTTRARDLYPQLRQYPRAGD